MIYYCLLSFHVSYVFFTIQPILLQLFIALLFLASKIQTNSLFVVGLCLLLFRDLLLTQLLLKVIKHKRLITNILICFILHTLLQQKCLALLLLYLLIFALFHILLINQVCFLIFGWLILPFGLVIERIFGDIILDCARVELFLIVVWLNIRRQAQLEIDLVLLIRLFNIFDILLLLVIISVLVFFVQITNKYYIRFYSTSPCLFCTGSLLCSHSIHSYSISKSFLQYSQLLSLIIPIIIVIYAMIENFSRSRDKKAGDTQRQHWEVDIKNLPQNINKEDIAHFLWKSLESCHGLIRNGNPIIQLMLIPQQKTLRLKFRSQQQALNCLLLNQIYFGKKALFISSRYLTANRHKSLNTQKLKIVRSQIHQKFRQIYVGNLPYMSSMEIINYLSEFGELKSFIDETKQTNQSSSCYCQYINDEQTQVALKKLDNSKLKGRSVIAQRAALMKTKEASKTKITISKGTRFESLDQMYMTFDTEGFFKNKKITCVLLLKGIIPVGNNAQIIVKDVKTQAEKIGPLVRVTYKNQNIYLEYERVQYSQIAYLLISKRKYDGKQIQVIFYDPIKFADDILL